MKELLDQQIPASPYRGGKLAGRDLRSVAKDKKLMAELLSDPDFKRHHRDLWEDLRFIKQAPSVYGALDLTAPPTE